MDTLVAYYRTCLNQRTVLEPHETARSRMIYLELTLTQEVQREWHEISSHQSIYSHPQRFEVLIVPPMEQRHA